MKALEGNFSNKIRAACEKKESLFDENFSKYAVRSIFAGSYLTLASLAGLVCADHISNLSPTLSKGFFALIFSLGLCYVLFLNTELATGNMMYLTAGSYFKFIGAKKALKILLVCTIFNLIGAYIVAGLVSLTSIGQSFNENSFFISLANAKHDKTSLDILFSAILANIFVNMAVLSWIYIENQGAKIFLIMMAVFMFVYIGLEHLVANFSLFALLQATKNAGDNFTLINVLRQWIFAFLGNYIGGGLLIGLIYSWLNDSKSKFID